MLEHDLLRAQPARQRRAGQQHSLLPHGAIWAVPHRLRRGLICPPSAPLCQVYHICHQDISRFEATARAQNRKFADPDLYARKLPLLRSTTAFLTVNLRLVRQLPADLLRLVLQFVVGTATNYVPVLTQA